MPHPQKWRDMDNLLNKLKELTKYTVEYFEHLDDCHGEGYVLRHKKSGARIALIANDDNNKCFAVGFRTPPADDTGVAHILEHSVLCGSKKFPAKDPFVELMKGSLNTFLNAITFSDKTIYPVASCNDKDFANLMDVYMDAVLNPNIYSRPQIFKQEGWHYDLADKDAPITINGVVYSEMKGAFSSPDSRLYRYSFNYLFPDTAYGTESGGDPKAIPTLTYENFLKFHGRYYHPANSYIFLYGDMDFVERLNWLDSEYLSKYDKIEVDSTIDFQKPIGTVEKEEFYPIADDQPDKDVSYLSWSAVCGSYKDVLDNMALDTIVDVLFNSPGAPIREALIKAGIGSDVSAYIDGDLMQSYLNVSVRNTEASKMPEFRRIIKEELKKAVEGLNRTSLLATINRNEFSYCEEDYGRTPKGLLRGINALSTWLYDDNDAFSALHRREKFGILRDKIDTGYFEELVRKYLLESESELFMTMAPKKGMQVQGEKDLEEKLAKYKASLSAEQIDDLVKDTAALKAYQSEPSTEEELLSIPLLTREDIGKKCEPLYNEHKDLGGIPVKFHEIETNGITYLKFLFNIDGLKEDELTSLALANKLIGAVNTFDHTYLEYNNEMNIHTGGIYEDVTEFNKYGNENMYRPYFMVEAKALVHEIDNLLKLTNEQLVRSDFSDITRIRELVQESKAREQANRMNNGVGVAFGAAGEAKGYMGVFDSYFHGSRYYDFVMKLAEADNAGLKAAALKAAEVLNKVLGSNNVIVDITCNKELFNEIAAKVEKFVKDLGEVSVQHGPLEAYGQHFPFGKANLAYKMAGDVNYMILTGGISEYSPKIDAAMAILSSMLSSGYLWNNVRVLGGAYGCHFGYSVFGAYGQFYSYRDPHLAETLEIYKGCVKYLEEFDADEREMTKAILGTIGGIDTPMTPALKGRRSLQNDFGERTEELIQAQRDAIINCTPADIRAAAKYMKEIIDQNNIAAVGIESSINAAKGLFSEVRNLL